MIKKELNGLLLEELEEYMKSIGAQKFRAEQLFVHFHRHRKWDIEDLNVLPKSLRDKLVDKAKINQIELYKRYDSKIDETKKYLFLLEDDNIIESVVALITRNSKSPPIPTPLLPNPDTLLFGLEK